MFDKTVATYKYYWLLGILDLFVKQGKTRMNVWEIMVTMVANAWYPVNYFRLSCEFPGIKNRGVKKCKVKDNQLIIHFSSMPLF